MGLEDCLRSYHRLDGGLYMVDEIEFRDEGRNQGDAEPCDKS